MKSRCSWAGIDPLYMEYHDKEWGVPLHDDRKLFELLNLEGAQAGLSWLTILRKRHNFRKAFDDFDPSKMAGYDSRKIRELESNTGIIRNKLKIEAAILNAKSFLSVRREFGNFERYIWRFVGGRPLKNSWQTTEEIPARTDISTAMAADLKTRGFKFVGPTICYAFMQAAGLVNDHTVHCFRYEEV